MLFRSEGRNPALADCVQASIASCPDRAVSRGQNRVYLFSAETFMRRKRTDGEVAKTVDSLNRGNPQVAFMILKNPGDKVPRQALASAEMVGFAIAEYGTIPGPLFRPRECLDYPATRSRPLRCCYSSSGRSTDSRCRGRNAVAPARARGYQFRAMRNRRSKE